MSRAGLSQELIFVLGVHLAAFDLQEPKERLLPLFESTLDGSWPRSFRYGGGRLLANEIHQLMEEDAVQMDRLAASIPSGPPNLPRDEGEQRADLVRGELGCRLDHDLHQNVDDPLLPPYAHLAARELGLLEGQRQGVE